MKQYFRNSLLGVRLRPSVTDIVTRARMQGVGIYQPPLEIIGHEIEPD